MQKHLWALGLASAVLAAPLSAQAGPGDGGPTAQQEAGRNRAKGALWGGGIGLVAGGILGGLSVQSDDDDGLGSSMVESAATGPAGMPFSTAADTSTPPSARNVVNAASSHSSGTAGKTSMTPVWLCSSISCSPAAAAKLPSSVNGR